MDLKITEKRNFVTNLFVSLHQTVVLFLIYMRVCLCLDKEKNN